MAASSRTSFSVLLTLSLISLAICDDYLVKSPSKDNSEECDCYLVDGPNPGYFQYHRFWDFRDIPSTSSDDYTQPPALITNSEDQGTEDPTSDYLSSSDFTTDWNIQQWIQAADDTSPIKMVNSAQNIYIARNTTSPSNSTYLSLRASRTKSFMSVAEIDNLQNNMRHASIRTRLRVIPNPSPLDPTHPISPGACLGVFTYTSSTSESDIEILTRDPVTNIRYSNQPDYNARTDTEVPGASTDQVLPTPLLTTDPLGWTEFLTHRLDWLPHLSRWFVDDTEVLNKSINVPRLPGGLILNLWGDGGPWSGNMSIGHDVTVAIEWIEMLFNVSGVLVADGFDGSDASGRGRKMARDGDLRPRGDRNLLAGADGSSNAATVCNVGCKVDGVARVGFPELVFGTPSASSAGSRSSSTFRSPWVLVIVGVVMGIWDV